MMLAQKSVIPYTFVDYLIAGRYAYFDTGVPAATDVKVVVKLIASVYSTRIISNSEPLFTSADYQYSPPDDGSTGCLMLKCTGGWHLRIHGGISSSQIRVQRDGSTPQEIECGNFYINDLTNSRSAAGTASDIVNATNIHVYGAYERYDTTAKLYTIKIYKSDALLRDLRACYRNVDGVCGFYSVVNGVFYESEATDRGTSNAYKYYLPT